MKKFIAIITLLSAFYSCKKDADNVVIIPPPPKVEFKGTWEGLYTGADDNGIFRVTIDSIGQTKGSVTSIVFDTSVALSGTANARGSITIAFGTLSSGGTFEGVLKDSTGSGTWEKKVMNQTFSGTWTGKKL